MNGMMMNQIDESDRDIFFNQDSYIDSMEEVEIQNKTDKSRVLNEDEQAFTSQQSFTKGKEELHQSTWISKKLRRVCRSTIAAETMSPLDAVDTTVWLSHLLDELKDKQLQTTEIYTDNTVLYVTYRSSAFN
ncbi:Hypothetical predicted protein [Paramuricea clavata]|uniref:Uncharacterized protein n=1 Tax=Paramuricea clavata TaxID=317549 RepID=A0A7D9EU09_PARCT|nr:Hypothetical predicted protein [Paramuricea clavata]